MRILITNDDGFLSPGLALLYRALSSMSNVKIDVVAPEKPQSAGGLSITLHKPLRVRKVNMFGIDMYVISGKPCDAVVYALTHLSDRYDLIVSGINLGENTSLQAILASGTIAPCIYASLMYRIPGLALSANTYNIYDLDERTRRTVMTVSREAARYVIEQGGYPEPLDIVSINFPGRVTESTRVVLCDVSELKFIHDMLRHVDPRGLDYYWVHGHFLIKPDLSLDTASLYIENNVVVTGLTFRRVSLLSKHDESQIERALLYLRNLVSALNSLVMS